MKAITKTELGTGNGAAAAIAEGKSLRITQRGEPLATLRPHRKNDKGDVITLTELYNHAGRYVDRAWDGETIVVTKNGEPFATLVKYEKRKAKKQTRAKRQSRPRHKPTPPSPSTSTKESGEPTKGETESEKPGLSEAIKILQAADTLPKKLHVELLELGAALTKGCKPKQGIALLRALKSLIAKE